MNVGIYTDPKTCRICKNTSSLWRNRDYAVLQENHSSAHFFISHFCVNTAIEYRSKVPILDPYYTKPPATKVAGLFCCFLFHMSFKIISSLCFFFRRKMRDNSYVFAFLKRFPLNETSMVTFSETFTLVSGSEPTLTSSYGF